MTKKNLLLLALILVFILAGCGKSGTDIPQTSTVPTTTAAPETTAAAEPETTAPAESETADTTAPAAQAASQSTQQTDPPAGDDDHGYLAALEAESDSLRARLQQEELTQTEMNLLSQELYELWDDALNDLWSKLRNTMPEDQFDRLLDEQLAWIADKEAAVQEAGAAAAGGSMAQLLMNLKAADLTEARVRELYGFLK